jgi:hypothetical protein
MEKRDKNKKCAIQKLVHTGQEIIADNQVLLHLIMSSNDTQFP